TKQYDVIVVGGGPTGTIAAMYLKKAGKDVLLIDKAKFPRDKICGDAQGRKAAMVMKELGIYEEYKKIPGCPIFGLRLSSPNGTQIDLTMIDRSSGVPGYVTRRMDFDNFLFQSAKALGIEIMEETAVTKIVHEDKAIREVHCKRGGEEFTLRAKVYIAADGAHSMFATEFGQKNPPEHLIVAVRQYWKGVTGLSDMIEIHLIKDLIPGYFWIFPLPNGEANVGLGMIIKDMTKKKVNLADALKREVTQNPLFVERFRNAKPLEDVKAWNLPIASHRRKCYGQNVMLIGDAAGLINPLSGEGVGTGVISAKLAAEVAIEAMEKNDYSEKFIKQYYDRLWEAIGEEIKADYRIMRLGTRFPFLIDRLINKAKKNPEARKELESHLPYVSGKAKIGTKEFISNILEG
ncbi:MAG: geranylgeranyl reductase family protein, partial [Candidatus Aenigmarchaeota archaeon]|nr:geranylgeranyl reductase family protein [Candidatus Aenigmarchaeota archaeon]